MGRSRRRDYARTLVCPECGCVELFESQDSTGTRHHGCVDCFALDGVVVEPVWTLKTLCKVPTRSRRLLGIAIDSPLRKTRSR